MGIQAEEIQEIPAMSPRVLLIPTTRERDVGFDVEVFNTPSSRAAGITGRTQWTKPAIFVMPRDGEWSFTTRDTLLPIDIVFVSRHLDDAGVVTSVVFGAPGSEVTHTGHGKWVLELPAGMCWSCHIGPGASVLLSGVPPAQDALRRVP